MRDRARRPFLLSLPRPRTLTIVLSIVLGIPFFLGLGLLTMWPSKMEDTAPGLLRRVLSFAHDTAGWDWLDFAVLEAGSNLLVFIPVGILAFLLFPRRWWPFAFLIGPVLSVIIEAVQAAALPQRKSTWEDVLTNSAGATIGALLALLCTVAFALGHRSSRLDPFV